MGDDSEEKPSTSTDFASTKAAIFDTLNKYKKWREEQREEFQSRQNLESERLLRLSVESQIKFEQLLDHVSGNSPHPEDEPKEIVPEISDVLSISLANDLENYNTLQESSITGHLQRCFNDSIQNVSVNENKVPSIPEKIPVFSELRNPQFSEKNCGVNDDQLVKDHLSNNPVKSKRPFLRKGSGLLRYMPKSATSGPRTGIKKDFSKTNKSPVKSVRLPQRTLKLKPAIRKTDVPVEHVKHIRFDISDSNENINVETTENNLLRNQEVDVEEKNSSVEFNSSENSKLEDASSSGLESLNTSKENKELEEFEMLENCAQNSSFNSESSVIQRLFHGESLKSPYPNQNYTAKLHSVNMPPTDKEIHKRSAENSNSSGNIGLSKCLEEVRSRKQMIQKVISDINPRILSLEKEISNSKKEAINDSDMSERCSTPIEDLSLEDKDLPESNVGSSDLEISASTIIPDATVDAGEALPISDCRCCNIDVLKNRYPDQANDQNIYNEEEESVCDVPNKEYENEVPSGKSRIREKLLELEKEIETYQQLNAQASSLCKERGETVRKLQKEQNDFKKYKEDEKKKLEAEIQEERRQIKREKENIKRYQKFSKDFPTKKEREELKALRQEIQKIQGELKQQKRKYTNDSRRWKNQVDVAESERDKFQQENIRLEEQCQDLLSALKSRMREKSEIKLGNGCTNESMKRTQMNKDAETQTDNLDSNLSKDSNHTPKSVDVRKTNSKVHFSLAAESEKDELGIVKDTNIHLISPSQENIFHSEKADQKITDNNRLGNVEKDSTAINLSNISVSVEAEFKEINHDKRVERIYSSGEREIVFSSGTRKVISPDGKTIKFFFYNGDVKEIFPDKREIYKYVNGTIESHFPDGLKVTEFPNGDTECCYPDGKKEVRFPDGTVHSIYADGSEEIRSADGDFVSLGADGTKTIEYANGQKEIITATYKKREFPDGSSKTIYDSGRLETRYSNGRIKIKNKEGKVLIDTKYILKG